MIRESYMGITVVIAEDHQIVREGLRSLIASEPDIEIVGEAEDGQAAVRLAEELKPDVVIMDVSMSKMGGMEATRRIKQTCPKTKIVALSAYDKREFIGGMLEAGASAYLLKDTAFRELVKAIRIVFGGNCFLSPQVASVVLNSKAGQAGSAASLESTDLELIRLLAEGKTARQIAEERRMSIKTIEGRRRRAMSKLGVDSFAGLVRYAVQHGLIDPSQPR